MAGNPEGWRLRSASMRRPPPPHIHGAGIDPQLLQYLFDHRLRDEEPFAVPECARVELEISRNAILAPAQQRHQLFRLEMFFNHCLAIHAGGTSV